MFFCFFFFLNVYFYVNIAAFLGDELKKYVEEAWPDGVVKIVRTTERSGLIRARLAGAKAATGDVLIFLDSHCEVGPGW